jgi:hypothetical protein
MIKLFLKKQEKCIGTDFVFVNGKTRVQTQIRWGVSEVPTVFGMNLVDQRLDSKEAK